MTTTELIELDAATDIKRFSPADTAIAEMAEQYMPLKIDGVDDRAGLKVVHDARMVVKSHRVAVEKTRKALKAKALDYGRKVDGEAKRLTALLEPIENHLQAEEDAYNAERERIKQERLQARLDKLAAIEVMLTPQSVEAMTDDAFGELLEEKTAEFEARKEAERVAEEERLAEEARLQAEREEREAEEARQRQAEEERLAAERKALEEERRQLEAERAERDAAIEAERKKLDEQRAAQQREQQRLDQERRLAEQERARQEAAERARIEAEQRSKREAEEAARRAEEEEAARIRAEQLRPDREKLLAVADVVAAIEVPLVAKELTGERDAIREILSDAAECIRKMLTTS